MVYKTVLVALVLALVACSYARPSFSEEYSERTHRDEDQNIRSKTVTIRYFSHGEKDRHSHKHGNKEHDDDHFENKHIVNSGKIHNCDETFEDEKPCVVDDFRRKNKKIMVQDTSSEEYDVADRKIIKALTSHEDNDKITLKQGQRPVPVYQGRWGRENLYRENQHNIEQRRGQDFEEELLYGRVPDDTQENKNKVHKH